MIKDEKHRPLFFFFCLLLFEEEDEEIDVNTVMLLCPLLFDLKLNPLLPL